MKKVYKKSINENIQSLLFKKFDTYFNEDDSKKLMNILENLTTGKVFYFYFFREELFLDDDEIEYCRTYIPKYLKKNGDYKILNQKDASRFESVGMMPINKDLFPFLIKMWNYFYKIVFFSPKKLSWTDFIKIASENNKDLNEVNFLESGYADSFFIKGHDGDYLIFYYLKNHFKLPELEKLEFLHFEELPIRKRTFWEKIFGIEPF